MSTLSRRDFLKITAVAGGALITPALAYRLLHGEVEVVSETRQLMGTTIHLKVVAQSQQKGQEALHATFTEMTRLIWFFDHRQPSSPLAILNSRGSLQHAPRELLELMGRALDYGNLTRGCFDVTIKPVLDMYKAGLQPGNAELDLVGYHRVAIDGAHIRFREPAMCVTLDAIAKGRVVDGALSVLDAHGFSNVLVEAGGDLIARGPGVDGRAWRVGIHHPRQEQMPGYISAFSLQDRAVATSGDYMNAFDADLSLHHILDPGTGSSPPALASATVIAPTAADADALSTALMLLGPKDGLALINRLPSAEALVVTKELGVRRTTGFPTLS